MSDKKTQAIINTLTDFISQGGDINQLKKAVNDFDQLVEKEIKASTVTVYSANELEKGHQDKIKQIIETNYQPNMEFDFKVDPKLLAGLKIQIKDYIIDMSLDSILKDISEKLVNQ